jgi:hypothetical protein
MLTALAEVRRAAPNPSESQRPHHVDQAVGADDLTGMQAKDGEQGRAPKPRNCQGPTVDSNIDRSEQPDLHERPRRR